VTLQDLGSIGEFVAAIATLATLAYLAVQIRHNTTSVRAASRLEIASSWRECNRLTLDSEARLTYATGLHEYPDMPLQERGLFGTLLADHAVFFQGTFALYEEGQLDEMTYQGYLTWFACQVVTPGGSAWWAETREFLVRGAASAVDARLVQGDLPDITQLSQLRLDDVPSTSPTETLGSSVPD
jgi:hypothetical protein